MIADFNVIVRKQFIGFPHQPNGSTKLLTNLGNGLYHQQTTQRSLSHSLNIHFIPHNSKRLRMQNTKSSVTASINMQEFKRSAKCELIQIGSLLIWSSCCIKSPNLFSQSYSSTIPNNKSHMACKSIPSYFFVSPKVATKSNCC